MQQDIFRLSDQPRWAKAAQALVDGCTDLPTNEQRVQLLEQFSQELGDHLYPAFLRVLALIGRFGDFAARAVIADTLVHALCTGRMPTGRLKAWGAAGNSDQSLNQISTDILKAGRSLGPIEYLCVWHAQPVAQRNDAQAMDSTLFSQAAPAILNLFDASPDARQNYADLLLAVADEPIEGALTRTTRQGLCQLAQTWKSGDSSEQAAMKFLDTLSHTSPSTLTSLAQQTHYPRP